MLLAVAAFGVAALVYAAPAAAWKVCQYYPHRGYACVKNGTKIQACHAAGQRRVRADFWTWGHSGYEGTGWAPMHDCTHWVGTTDFQIRRFRVCVSGHPVRCTKWKDVH